MQKRDISETDGRDKRQRRMPLIGKAKTDGLSGLIVFHLGDIRLCHWLWSSQSRRRMSPRQRTAETDAPEADVSETDGAETDDPETDVPETDGLETDVPEYLFELPYEGR